MILRQYLHNNPISISYFFGCVGKASGAIIDPSESPDFYIQAANEANVQIKYVIDTHIHADHISTGRKLAETTGAEYILSDKANVNFSFRGVKDQEELHLGNVVIKVLQTPGHTPEHISLLVKDKTRSEEPWFVVTGHTLMAGDLGRTELATNLEQGAKDLFESIQRLKSLPDHIEVLPGAYAGSVCGRSLSGKPWSTIGFEKRYNLAFKIDNEKEFVNFMSQEVPPPPAEAAKIRSINAGME